MAIWKEQVAPKKDATPIAVDNAFKRDEAPIVAEPVGVVEAAPEPREPAEVEADVAPHRVLDVGVIDDHLRARHGVAQFREALALLLDEEGALVAFLLVLDQLHWSPYLAR